MSAIFLSPVETLHDIDEVAASWNKFISSQIVGVPLPESLRFPADDIVLLLAIRPERTETCFTDGNVHVELFVQTRSSLAAMQESRMAAIIRRPVGAQRVLLLVVSLTSTLVHACEVSYQLQSQGGSA